MVKVISLARKDQTLMSKELKDVSPVSGKKQSEALNSSAAVKNELYRIQWRALISLRSAAAQQDGRLFQWLDNAASFVEALGSMLHFDCL